MHKQALLLSGPSDYMQCTKMFNKNNDFLLQRENGGDFQHTLNEKVKPVNNFRCTTF